MTITIVTGIPGAGKTALVVKMIIDTMDKDGQNARPVYVCNLADLAVPHIPLDNANEWPDKCVDGSLIVIDEVQRYWRPTPSGSKVPPYIELLETHRHRGLDFILITQRPKLIHANVRELCGRYIFLRDVGLFGRKWYEWYEMPESVNYKQAPIKKYYKLPKKVFDKYKSATVHVKPQRTFPKAVVVVGVCALALPLLVWRVVDSISSKMKPTMADAAVPSVVATAPAKPASAPVLSQAKSHEGGQDATTSAIAGVRPANVGGCWIDDTECRCVMLSQPPRIATDLGKVCVQVARGELAAHPSHQRPTRVEPDPMRDGAGRMVQGEGARPAGVATTPVQPSAVSSSMAS